MHGVDPYPRRRPRSRRRPVARVVWTGGTELQAATWEDMFWMLADEQWTEYDAEELIAEMSHRAKVWSNTRIDTDGSYAEFFRELERAKMLTIMEDPEA